MKAKFILKNPHGDVYAPYGDRKWSSMPSNAEIFNGKDAVKKAKKLVGGSNLEYIQIIPVIVPKK